MALGDTLLVEGMPHATTTHNATAKVHAAPPFQDQTFIPQIVQGGPSLWSEIEDAAMAAEPSSEPSSFSSLTPSPASHHSPQRPPPASPETPSTPPPTPLLHPTQGGMRVDYIELVLVLVLCSTFGAASLQALVRKDHHKQPTSFSSPTPSPASHDLARHASHGTSLSSKKHKASYATVRPRSHTPL